MLDAEYRTHGNTVCDADRGQIDSLIASQREASRHTTSYESRVCQKDKSPLKDNK